VNRERRRARRFELLYFLPIRETGKPSTLGRLADISKTGLKVLSEEALPLQTEYSLELEVPEEVSSEGSLRFQALSLWGKQDVNPDYHITGFSLIEPPAELKAAIEKLVTTLRFSA
jgi:hypothetical protein